MLSIFLFIVLDAIVIQVKTVIAIIIVAQLHKLAIILCNISFEEAFKVNML